MSPALIIAQLLVQYGLPLATTVVEKWTRDEPGNPAAADWLALLQSPSLTRTYDQQIQAAAERATGKPA